MPWSLDVRKWCNVHGLWNVNRLTLFNQGTQPTHLAWSLADQTRLQASQGTVLLVAAGPASLVAYGTLVRAGWTRSALGSSVASHLHSLWLVPRDARCTVTGANERCEMQKLHCRPSLYVQRVEQSVRVLSNSGRNA